jgi:transcriptional regulator of acetoin/glycerol metabolism
MDVPSDLSGLELRWRRTVGAGDTSSPAPLDPIGLSWERSRQAGVSPGLCRAPVVLDPQALAEARAASDWIELAEAVLTPHLPAIDDASLVLVLSDTQGRLLASAGNPRTLDGLNDIAFAPGATWAESAVGTNGPGTALATGRPVHVVGAQHFCEAWHRWHCAAVPVRDLEAGVALGALDLSGPATLAHGNALQLAGALASAVEQALLARARLRQGRILHSFAELAARHPGAPLLAIDRTGRVLAASATARSLRVPERVALQGETLVAHERWLEGAEVRAVSDAGVPIGACVVGTTSAAPIGRRAGTRYRLADFVGRAPAVHRALELARSAAANRLPVLLIGESGVGKEVLAQSIHAASDRRGAFVAVNCAALPRELVESELFGYVGGAFSGARRQGQVGRFQAADGGTLFLDEVADLPLPAQAALLRVLQEGEVTPVGSPTAHDVDVRVVAAANRPLRDAVAAGTFRRDLFYRLDVLTIEIPPLRERPEDIPELVERFTQAACRETGRCIRFDDEALAALGRYGWPGNVRELENLVRRLSAQGGEGPVGVDDLPADVRSASTPVRFAVPAAAPDGERERLARAVAGARNMAEAAAALGMTRSTLYRHMERLGLAPKRTVTDRDETRGATGPDPRRRG